MNSRNYLPFVLWFDRIAPAMLRQASYGTIKIGTYQSLKRLFVERPEGEWGILSALWTRQEVGSLSFYSGGFGSDFLQLLCNFSAAEENSGCKF